MPLIYIAAGIVGEVLGAALVLLRGGAWWQAAIAAVGFGSMTIVALALLHCCAGGLGRSVRTPDALRTNKI